MKTQKVVQAIDTVLSHGRITTKNASILKALREQIKPRRTFCQRGTKILSRDSGQEGTTTGGTRPCTMEGCTGVRIAVRWPDGKLTYPCSKGLDRKDGKYHIM